MVRRDTFKIAKYTLVIIGVISLMVLGVVFVPNLYESIKPTPTLGNFVSLFTSTPEQINTFVPTQNITTLAEITPDITQTAWWLTETVMPGKQNISLSTTVTPTLPSLAFGNNTQYKPVVANRKLPSTPLIGIDSKNIPHAFWFDKSKAESGDIFESKYEYGVWTEPINLTDEGALPDKISLKSIQVLRSPTTKNLYLYWSGFPEYGDVLGGYYERKYSEDNWYGRRKVIETVNLIDYDITPTFGSNGLFHTMTKIGDPKIDWITLSESFTETNYRPDGRSFFLIDKDNYFHVISKSRVLQDRYSPLHKDIGYRKWELHDIGDAADFNAYLNNNNYASVVSRTYDNLLSLYEFRSDTGWSVLSTYNLAENWDKNDKVKWWKVVSNGKNQYALAFHESNNLRVLDLTDSRIISTNKGLKIDYMSINEDGIDAALDDKVVVNIVVLNDSDSSLYYFKIE